MALSAVVKNFRDGTLVIEDGTAITPLNLTVQYESGDFSVTGLNQAGGTSYETTQYLDRGEMGTARKTNRAFPSGSFTAQLTELSDGTNETLPDILLKQGSFSAAVSTLGASADVYAVKLSLQIEGTDHGDTSDHSITLDDCVCSLDIAEGDPDTFSISFQVLGAVTMT